MDGDLSQLEAQLSSIMEHAPGGRMMLSALGEQLRQRLPGFDPRQYGKATLKALLQSTSAGRVEPGANPLEWWLVRPGAPGGTIRIRPDWFRALTEFDVGRRTWFDLRDETLVSDAQAVEVEPNRYVELPRIGRESQEALAREWLGSQPPEVAAALEQALTVSLQAFHKQAEVLDVSAAWSRARSRAVVSALVEWAQQHGIAPERYRAVERPPEPRGLDPDPPARVPSPPLSDGFDELQLRALLHRAIDEMTLHELGQIAVPARFLLRR